MTAGDQGRLFPKASFADGPADAFLSGAGFAAGKGLQPTVFEDWLRRPGGDVHGLGKVFHQGVEKRRPGFGRSSFQNFAEEFFHGRAFGNFVRFVSIRHFSGLIDQGRMPFFKGKKWLKWEERR
ncbi:MAG: hypothetical protein ACLFRG_02765 [Desulfococcaceae bacterium]